jgi:glycosyltransferase involved in cell wall biosynthesis
MAVKTVYLYDSREDLTLPLHRGDICLDGAEDHFLERFPKFDPGLLRKIVREIKRFEPDVVQVNGSRTVKYGAMAKRLAGEHWSLIYRNIGIPSDWHHWWGTILVYRRAIMPLMDGVVGVSHYSLQNATSIYHMRAPSTVILNGISPDRLTTTTERNAVREAAGVEERDVVLLFVGFLDEVKRPDRYLRLVERLSRVRPGIRGWIVGDGPLREEMERLTSTLGLLDRVRFFGTQDDVASFMQAADVFVVTSKTEGVPAVVLEAGYMGLPVVATRVGGLPECVREGETGLLVDSESERQMDAAILKLVDDPQLRARMGENARRWIGEHLTIEHIADRYLEFYRTVREDGKSSPLNP